MKLTFLAPCTLANGRSLLVAWLLATALAPPAIAASTLKLDVAPPTSANESNRTAFLTWTAEADQIYRVQSSTNAAKPAAWTTVDAVSQSVAGPLKWMAPESLASTKYYRLVLPQPQILSVEPAVVAPGAAVDFYVIGQCFPTNGVLQVNSVPQAGAVVVSSSLATIPGFTPGAAGNYQVSLMVGGVAVSSFNVVCADALANPELVLQGPPTEDPPASPSFKGMLTETISCMYETVKYGRMAGHGNTAADNLCGTFTLTPYSISAPGGGGDPASKEAPAKKTERSRYECEEWKITMSRMAGGGGGGGPTVTSGRGEWVDSRHAYCLTTAVMPFSGEVQACAVDMAIPGRRLDFVWARTYRSRTGHTATMLGNGWTCSYDVRCAQNSSGGMDVYDGTGRQDSFALGTNGIYTCPEFFREGALSNNTFTLTFADTGRWVFNSFDASVTAGLIHQVITRNGDTITLSYDTSGRLAQIVDDLGRTNTVAYDTSGRVASVTDFTGRSVTYQYYSGAKSDNGSAGDLKSVTSPPVIGTPAGNDFPSGKTTTYTYSKSFPLDRENHLLLTVTDPKGQPAAVFTYEHSSTSTNYLRCIAAQEGTNTAYQYHWVLVTRPAGSYATTKCIVNDPMGNVSEYFLDARNRCVLEDDYTGHATPGLPVTDTGNRPTGKLRSSDPNYYEARWSWNNDSLCTLAVAPGGQQMQYVYQSDFDPATTAHKRADCRVARETAASAVDLNGDGVPDVTARAWHFDYDLRFGTSGSYRWRKAVLDGQVDRRSISVIFHNDAGEEAAYHTKGTGLSGFTDDGDSDGGTYMAINEKGYDNGPVKKKRRTPRSTAMTKPNVTGPLDHGFGDVLASAGLVPTSTHIAIHNKGTGISGKLIPTVPPAGGGVLPIPASFVTSATDSRGNVTSGAYDTNGNCLHVSRPASDSLDLAYNTYGQLIAITNAPGANGSRRVDTFTYYTSGPQSGYLQSIAIDESGVHLPSVFECDALGNVTRAIDPRGNDGLFTYNALNQCVRAQSPPNISARCVTDFAYDANDNLVQCATELRDAADNLVGTQMARASYDGLDRLAEIARAVDASHALTNRFVYDGNNQCVQVLGGDAVSGVDPNQTVAYQYDERRLLFRESSAPGSTSQSTSQLDYDANGHPTRVSEGLEGTPSVTTIEYDGFAGFGASPPSIENNTTFFLTFTFKLVAVKTMSWAHERGVRDPQWLVDWPAGELPTSLRVSKITDPMGNETVYFYDANDNLKVVRRFGELNDVPGSAGNVRLAESGFQYDAHDHCVLAQDMFFNPATQSPFGSGKATTTFAYAPNSACVSVTDTLGHTTTYGYDTACRTVSVTDALGNQQSVVYDAGGNPLAGISSEVPAAGGPPQVFSITNVYDSLNRCVSTTDSAGNTSGCAYDSLGRCVQTTDPRGTRTFYTYDFLNRCTLAIGDMNGDGMPDLVNDITTTYTWSGSSGNLLAVTDSNTNTTSYVHDSLGRCTSATSPNGTHHTFVWDTHSNLVSEQDANGTVIAHAYNLNSRCISNNITPGAGVASTTTFETFAYDGCGWLTGAANDGGSTAFACDSLGNCVSETLNGLATTSTYDALGNRLSLTYPGGRSLTCTYDALNRCASIADSGQQLATYAYDGRVRVSVINYGNGTRKQITYDGLAGTPNAAGDNGFGQVRSVRHSVVAGGAVIEDRTLAYDADQNKTIRDMTSPFTLGGAAQAMAFQYDLACRLVGSLVTTNGTQARLTSYRLDRMGNRTNVTGAASCSGDYTMSSATPPADFQMNQYTTTPCDARTYDHNGNLASRRSAAGPVTCQYDYANRLVQVQALDSGLGTLSPLASYSYDASGRRVSKTLYSGSTSTTTQFLYDGGSVIEERSGTTTTATYVLCDRIKDGTETDAVGGVCLTMRLGTQDYYVHTDDQGNALALTGTTGGVVERYDYDDYGVVTFLASDGTPTTATSSTVGNPYCWHGLRLDAETGLQNDDGAGYLETTSGRGIVNGDIWCWGDNRSGMIGNNPWSPNTPPPPVAYKIKAMGANGEGKKEYVGHVSLLK